MPCGQICKEILDGGAAAQRSFSCMSNTILLGHGEPDNAAHAAFMSAATAYAAACVAVAEACHASQKSGQAPPA